MRRRFIVPTLCLLCLLASAVAQTAPAGSSSSKSNQKVEQHVKRDQVKPTAPDEGLYRNAEFGFTYLVRYGWVDRTTAMQPEDADASKSRLVLAVFERPPEVTGDTVNSAVIVAVESAASYPGLKTAADYMGPLTELTTAKGFRVAQEPYEFSVGSKRLVRSDFVKDIGQLSMHQSSLVEMQKGKVLSFTFIGGSEDEVDELVEKLVFPRAVKSR